MTVIVNGEKREFGNNATVAGVVASVTEASTGVAVAVNGELVTRDQWRDTPLHEADRLDVLTAAPGG